MEERQFYYRFVLFLIANRVCCPPSEGKEGSFLRTSTASWRLSSPPPPANTNLAPAQAKNVCWDKPLFSLLGRMLNFSRRPPPLFHCCSFSLPNPSVAWEERQKKGVCSCWRVLFRSGAAPVEEALPDLRGGGQWPAAFSSFGCNPEQGLRLLPLIPSGAGLGQNGNRLILICLAG